MSESMVMVMVVATLAGIGALGVAWQVYGWRLIWFGLIALPWITFMILKYGGRYGGRAALRIGSGSARVRNPDRPVSGRRRVNPTRMPGVERLRNGLHYTAGGVVEAVHKLVVAMSGAGKNQADLNYELQHQLLYSDEHLILTDPKAKAPLSQIVRAYARPEDRIFVYSFHPRDPHSSALRLFRDPGELADLAYMLTDEPNDKDSHWNGKAGDLIAAVATALTEEDGAGGEITATLNAVRDVIADRVRLEEMRDASAVVSNVADIEKEWGSIRSTATRRLEALSNPVVRRVFAGRPDDPQPDLSRTNGRDIVIIRPHPRSAKRLARFIYAVLDANYRAAADGGDASGPGTKVLIDEAASYMRLANLAEYLDLGRESKVQVTYVLQGTKQLAAKLGEKEAEAIISSTEVKVVGKTDDGETATMISELSAPMTVHYRRPAQSDELRGEWAERERRLIEPFEITSQEEGQFTIQHGARVTKVAVPATRYHYTQMPAPRRRRLYGVADPDSYIVPPLLDPPDPPDEDLLDGGNA